ncbi:MAG: pyridoxamine 5'-phosphate oxidase family protein [Pseudomonadota bacterium]
MTDAETAAERMWTLAEEEPDCHLVTATAQGQLRSRPMRAFIDRENEEVLFYTRLDTGKSREVSENAQVCLCFSRPSKNDYVSISGRARITTDRALVDRHWSRFVEAWFPEGPGGADVGMIRVQAERGEYWEGTSSSVLAALKMLRASARDETPELGRRGKTEF